jgi:hypothetical protein
MPKWILCLTLLTLPAFAGEKDVMHCFAFTAIDGAPDGDWQAFFQASDALPSKIPAIKRVWYGKLQNSLNVFSPDAAARKEYTGGAKSAKGEFTRLQRQWGMCMEMENEAALKGYVDNPAHKDWEKAYFKVRVPGTTTFNLLGQ